MKKSAFKKITFFIFTLLFCQLFVQGQILHPVKWSYRFKKISSNEAVVFLKASIDNQWHIYSQYIGDGGPTKTVFIYQSSKDYTLIGKTIEPISISHFDKMFNMKIGYFEKEVIFQQKIRFNPNKKVVFKGNLEYGVCNDHQCLPPDDLTFEVAVN